MTQCNAASVGIVTLLAAIRAARFLTHERAAAGHSIVAPSRLHQFGYDVQQYVDAANIDSCDCNAQVKQNTRIGWLPWKCLHHAGACACVCVCARSTGSGFAVARESWRVQQAGLIGSHTSQIYRIHSVYMQIDLHFGLTLIKNNGQ